MRNRIADCTLPAPRACLRSGQPNPREEGAAELLSARAGEKSIFTMQLTIGCVVAMAGFCWYSHCKLYERLGQQAAAAKDAQIGNPVHNPKASPSAAPASGHAAAAGLRGRTQSAALGDEEAPMATAGEADAGESRPLLGGGGGPCADLAGGPFAHHKHSIAGGRLSGAAAGYGDKAFAAAGVYAGLLKAGLPSGVYRADVRASTREQEV